MENEHVVGSGAFQRVDYPGSKKPAAIADHPVRFSKTPVAAFKRAPTLSEHTQDIMTSLGYSQDEIEAFREQRVI